MTKGNHTLTCTFGTNVLTKTLNVTALDFYVTPAPNPPMAKDNNISITPTTRNFGVGGGGNAIIVSGSSATWTAAVSDPWITLNATSGNVGYPVAYTVSANTNVEQRTGYVYVSGWTHTVTQDGVGGTISPESRTVEYNGASGTITVSAANNIVWQARPNVNWINVTPTSGSGAGSVSYNVAPYDEVATRQGTLTVAGNTFTVFQYGRRMKLSTYNETQNYETHVIPITVNALAITQWSVTPNNSWISVVDAGNGQGGDLVSIVIAENPSYKARTGTVKIGTETFTVTQQGRPTAALSFSVSPTASTASVEGANGLIAVTATPDLPWTATSGANWLTVYAATATGAGNGNVVYSASPNPTLSQRTGNITITPEAASGMTAKTHKVTQPAAQSALSSNGYEFEAAGESCSVDVSVANIVQWSISESLDWITVNGSTSRTGPGTVVLQASANNTVYPRSGTVKIAGKNFSVSQKARGVELEYDTKLFGTDGGMDSISIHPDGNSSWTAVASDATWITIFQGDSGTGDGEIMYIVSPYVGNGSARTGWITVGSQKVYITQRPYDLNIEPNGTNVVGNAGAGEFCVTAYINDVWTAIVTEPWITIVSGYDSGTGSGVVRFLYTENTTGKTRTGKIIVAGEVYTLEQRARQMVSITATAEHGGHVSGAGSYDLGTQVTLTAVPDSGYTFSYWTGAASSMQNPLTVTADTAKSYTAVFAPMPIAFTSVVSDTTGVTLSWNNLAWAGTYRIYRGVTSVPSSAVMLVELQNSGNCTYLDTTGDVDVEYWYWIEAEGPSDEVMSDPMTGRKEKPIVYSSITYENLRGATNPNPATYREGTLVSFQNPGAVTGYTFAGWTPSQITAEMTGAQTVRAAWTANVYSIAYNSNGGSGTMSTTAATYDSETTVAANGFTWTGHVFTGWATNASGEVVYAAGQHVTNLTAQSSGVVTLYAVWETLEVAPPQIFPADGSEFTGNACEVMILCATEGATIYYSPSGTTPRLTDAYLYTGPFTIADTATIKAIAVLDGVRSEYVTATITKRTLSLGEAASADAASASLNWTTGGDAQWTPISDATTLGGYSVQSGTISDAAGEGFTTTWLQTVVEGAGTISFRWKVDCEWDDSGDATWDHVAFYTNGIEAARMDGTSGWVEKSFTFADSGTHTLRWTFMKDNYNDDTFPDRAWVSGFTWTPPPDPIPEIGGDGDVSEALAGSADERLCVHINTAAEYNAYRTWVDAKGLDHQAVKGSARAWFSYAIGANGLVERTFQSDDVKIDSLATASDGSFTFEVDIKDVPIGAGATAANLATVFEVQGSPSLDARSFSPGNVIVVFGVSPHGRLSVSATPKTAHGTFFVRVRIHPEDDGWTGDTHGKVQLWEGGPYWAETNLGADEPWDYGYYFWWGDTIGYKRENDAWVASDGSSTNFSFSAGNSPTYEKSVDALKSEGWITADGVLVPEHDAAQVHWGGKWRMPTDQELYDLNSKCDWILTTTNGVSGYVVRGRGNYASNSIFLPIAGVGLETSLHGTDIGYYWSSVPSQDSYFAWLLDFALGYYYHGTENFGRPEGYPVRPVQEFTE
ncbi:MAG: InlB B-repeat-containing protein [Kiritimatiellae bacterium]|nr:InlB B-repeat-containing protein [Kiritimatiellia bacterium]